MAYTPTTWANGDTITPEKLNKLEQGVANSGGTATIRLSATGYSEATRIFGYLVYAYLDNGAWKLCNDLIEFDSEIQGLTTPNDRVLVKPLSSDDNVGLFLINQAYSNTITGNISTHPITLYFSYGSPVHGSNNAYRIMGNGSFEFIAD